MPIFQDDGTKYEYNPENEMSKVGTLFDMQAVPWVGAAGYRPKYIT